MSGPDLRSLAFVALGSNLGDPPAILRQAMDRLESLSQSLLLRSSLYQSDPVDCPDGSPAFTNAVVGLDPLPGETPESLMEKLQQIERDFGRQRKVVLNEARPLDLDLIAFRQEMRNDPRLILPHPRAIQRRFVLEPLSEIAPELVMPGQPHTASHLSERLPVGQPVRRLTNG